MIKNSIKCVIDFGVLIVAFVFFWVISLSKQNPWGHN